jgi:hypothetical protein
MVVVVASYGRFLTASWSEERVRAWIKNLAIGEQVVIVASGLAVFCWQVVALYWRSTPDVRSSGIALWIRDNLWLLLASWLLLVVVAHYATLLRHGWAVIGAFMLMIGTSFGLAIKNLNKDFVSTAAGITARFSGSGAPLTVVKHPFDEYLDPVLYYLGQSVLIVSPQHAQLPPANTWIVTKREILDGWLAQGHTPAVLERYFELSARLDVARPEDPRQVILVRFDDMPPGQASS